MLGFLTPRNLATLHGKNGIRLISLGNWKMLTIWRRFRMIADIFNYCKRSCRFRKRGECRRWDDAGKRCRLVKMVPAFNRYMYNTMLTLYLDKHMASYVCPANTNDLYNIYTMLDQRRRRFFGVMTSIIFKAQSHVHICSLSEIFFYSNA